jgi:hypothetical protein
MVVAGDDAGPTERAAEDPVELDVLGVHAAVGAREQERRR